jgi:hypothetical protein
MKTIYVKAAAIIAAIVGLMAVGSGGTVLLGRDPGYYVIDWVPVYNVAIGAISLFFTSILLWRNSRYAAGIALLTLAMHSLVMILLQTILHDVVAADSIRAMTIRIVTWLLIGGLLLLQRRKDRGQAEQPVAATVSEKH